MQSLHELLLEGLECHQAGQNEQAKALFLQILDREPDHFEALQFLGVLAYASGDCRGAIQWLRRAAATPSAGAMLYTLLGGIHEDLREYKEAIACYGAALKHDPNLIDALYRMGDLLLRPEGSPAAAAECFRRILQQRPDHAEAKFALSLLTETSTPVTLPADFVTSLFDTYASNFDHELVEGLGYQAPRLLREAVGSVEPRRDLDILDLGCGTGLSGLAFQDMASRLTGVDLSENMLAKAAERGVYAELIQADVAQVLAGRQEAHDLILMLDLLPYVGDLTQLLPAAARALRPGGLLAFTAEMDEGAHFTYQTKVMRFAHSLDYIQEMAALCGLKERITSRGFLRKQQDRAVEGLFVVLGRD